MPVAGYAEQVFVRADTTTPTLADRIDGIRDFSFSRSRETEETTDFADGSGYKTRLAKLKDSSVDMSGQYEAGDAVQSLPAVRACAQSRSWRRCRAVETPLQGRRRRRSRCAAFDLLGLVEVEKALRARGGGATATAPGEHERRSGADPLHHFATSGFDLLAVSSAPGTRISSAAESVSQPATASAGRGQQRFAIMATPSFNR